MGYAKRMIIIAIPTAHMQRNVMGTARSGTSGGRKNALGGSKIPERNMRHRLKNAYLLLSLFLYVKVKFHY